MFRRFFSLDNIDKSWNTFFDNNSEYFNAIANKLSCETGKFTPANERVFAFAKTPLENVKVIILGQDPYPQEGAATGIAFECGIIKSWTEPFRQASLKNILRAIYAAYERKEISWPGLRSLIEQGRYNIAPPDLLFKSWSSQGALLLNASLTCLVGKPSSHRILWNGFSRKVISFICDNTDDPKWFLFGASAREARRYIYNGSVYQSRHPMMCGTDAEDDFLKWPCFYETRDIINWRGINA